MNLIRLVIADDHAVVRAGLARFMDNEPEIVISGEASSGEQAYQLFNDLSPHVLIMDMSMPGMSGLEAMRRILARHELAKIIMYTINDDPRFAALTLNAGAMGYVTKFSETTELIKAIKAVSVGTSYISIDMAQKLAMQNVSENQDPMKCLTTKEFEIFRLLAEGSSVKAIASTLNIGSKTIANYQTQIKHKLDIHSSVEFVRLAIKHNIIQEN